MRQYITQVPYNYLYSMQLLRKPRRNNIIACLSETANPSVAVDQIIPINKVGPMVLPWGTALTVPPKGGGGGEELPGNLWWGDVWGQWRVLVNYGDYQKEKGGCSCITSDICGKLYQEKF